MFFKNNTNHLKFEIILNDNAMYQINATYRDQLVGQAVYINQADKSLVLTWIEINEQFQRRGFASAILDYLYQKAVDESKLFIIKVVDEELLDLFYFKWFLNQVNSDNESSREEVTDYFNNLITKKGDEHFNRNQPTLVLRPEDIHWKPSNKVDDLKRV